MNKYTGKVILNHITAGLNLIVVIFLMLDSGGGIGLRNISFLIIIIFSLVGCVKFKSFNKIFLIFYLVFLCSIIPAIFISVSNPQIALSSTLVWIVSFLIIPILYLYIKGSKINNQTFVFSGTLLAVIIIGLFFGRLNNVAYINTVNDYLRDHSDGFFANKSFSSGDVLPNVYFQGTLSLIICGVLSLEKKQYIPYLLILIALVLAPSRFGFIVLILWGCLVFVRKSIVRIFAIPFIALVFFTILYNIPFGAELSLVFNSHSDGIEVRNGHISSIFNEFQYHPLALLIGEGPGSRFYTQGYNAIVDNIELSQFEYLRKYGIISFICFTVFYFWPLTGKKKSSFYIKGALVMYYIVSFSNPVLYSIFAMLFLTYSYLTVFDRKLLSLNNNLNAYLVS